MFSFGANMNISTTSPSFSFGTGNSNNATTAATAKSKSAAAVDTLYSGLDASLISECIGIDLPTYLIRQRVESFRQVMKAEFTRTLNSLFANTLCMFGSPVLWEDLIKSTPAHNTYNRFGSSNSVFVKLRKDVWSFQPNGVPASSVYDEVLSNAAFELKFQGIKYYSPDNGNTYYMSKAAYYQSPIAETIKKYNEEIDKYKERIQKLNDWESEFLAACNAEATQLPLINLQECLCKVWDTTMPINDVEPKTSSITAGLEDAFQAKDQHVEADTEQYQQLHVENEHSPDHAEGVTLQAKNHQVSMRKTYNRRLQQVHVDTKLSSKAAGVNVNVVKQQKVIATIKPSKSDDLLCMVKPTKAQIELNEPALDVEAVYLDHPTHTELLHLINYNALILGKGSYLATCLKSLHKTVDCETTEMSTLVEIMIAHIALRLLDFPGSVYIDKYRKMIQANDIWDSDANFSRLNIAKQSTITWIKENTPSLFLTDATVQAKFQKAFFNESST